MKPTDDEVYAVNATIKALDKLDKEYLQHPQLKVACRAARAAFLKALSEAEGAKASNGGEEAMKPIYIWRGILKRPHGETWQVIRYSSDKNAAIKAASKLDQVVERVLPGKTGHAKIIWP